MIKIICLAAVMSILQSCAPSNGDVDAIVLKHSSTDFSVLKNRLIYFRSRGVSPGSSVYFINIPGSSCSPYVVDFDDKAKKVIEVRNNLVLSSCAKDCLSKKEIEGAMNEYIKYDVCLLRVDAEGNVYINPDQMDFPTLLRKAKNSQPKDLSNYRLTKEIGI